MLPIGRSAKVREPKRPTSALFRSNGVHHTLVRVGVQENTIAVGAFDQAIAFSYSPEIMAQEIFLGHFQMQGELADFFRTDPNKARPPGATPTASGASKSQSLVEPRRTVHQPGNVFRNNVSVFPGAKATGCQRLSSDARHDKSGWSGLELGTRMSRFCLEGGVKPLDQFLVAGTVSQQTSKIPSRWGKQTSSQFAHGI